MKKNETEDYKNYLNVMNNNKFNTTTKSNNLSTSENYSTSTQ